MTHKIKKLKGTNQVNTPRVALYIRVSTQEQVDNSSIPTQQERLEAYCVAKGWIVYDTYIDPGYSGSNIERPAMKRLLKDLKHIDAVMVYKLDRLSRSQRDTLELIEEHFLKNNVDFVSITENLDTSSPYGKAMIGILSAFAQLERETIAERMRGGLIKRAEAGYWVAGGNYEPAGYGVKNDGDLYIKEDEAAHVQAAYNYYEQLHSITKMQAKLKDEGYKVWRFRRYRDILCSRLYIGEVSFAGVYYKGRHKPLITKEQFDRVQILLSRHKGTNAHKAKASLLSGLITCGDCGEQYLTYQSKDKYGVYRYYICRARRFPSEYGEKCMNKTWNYQKLEQLIIEEISNLGIEKKTDIKKEKKIDYEKLIKKVNDKMKKTLGLYLESTNIPHELLNEQISELEEEKIRLMKLRDLDNQESIQEISKDDLDQYTIDLTTGDFATRQAVVHKLIREIIVHGENVSIVWNF